MYTHMTVISVDVHLSCGRWICWHVRRLLSGVAAAYKLKGIMRGIMSGIIERQRDSSSLSGATKNATLCTDRERA